MKINNVKRYWGRLMSDCWFTFFPLARRAILISIGVNFPVRNNVLPAKVTSCIRVIRPINLLIPSSIVRVSRSTPVLYKPASTGFNFNVLRESCINILPWNSWFSFCMMDHLLSILKGLGFNVFHKTFSDIRSFHDVAFSVIRSISYESL